MCTALKWHDYFGRTLDDSTEYDLNLIITPRHYKFSFDKTKDLGYTIMGLGVEYNDYPLYFEGVNEYGLAIAALEFKDYAIYHQYDNNKINIPSYELIPYILRNNKTINEVKLSIKNISIWDKSISTLYPAAPLHYLVSDEFESIVIEQSNDGLKIYDNKYNVLANNPKFSYHLENIKNYVSLTPSFPANRLSSDLSITPFSNGIGAYSLPGDYSSASRFIKTVYMSFNATYLNNNKKDIIQFFNILSSVSPIPGVVINDDNKLHYTIYTSCIDCSNLIYYYKFSNDIKIKEIELKSYLNSNDKKIIKIRLI